VTPRRVVGIDIGGTAIKLGAVELGVDAAGDEPRIVHSTSYEGHTIDPLPERIDRMTRAIRAVETAAGWDAADAVGVGIAGLVDQELGGPAASPNLESWTGWPLRRELARATGQRVRVENDATAFALAEWLWGEGRGADDALFLTLGTGIGGGLVSGGRILRGSRGFAGEPGHMTLDPGGARCACGNQGCAETVVGRDAVIRRAREHPGFAADPLLGDKGDLTPRDLHEAATRGSVVARDVWRETGEALGRLLVSLVNLLDPERIVVGGGLAQAGELLLEPAGELLAKRSMVGRRTRPRLVPARFGTEAGLLGAAGLWAEGETDGAIRES